MQDVARLAGLVAARDVDAARALAATVEGTNPGAATLARTAIDETDPARATQHAATLYLIAGETVRAIETARAALALGANAPTKTSIGGVLVAAGEYAEAFTLLKSVVEETPNDRLAHQNLATAAFGIGNVEAAIAGYARAFDLDPTNLEPLTSMVDMFAQLGKWLGALTAVGIARQGTPPTDIAIALDLSTMQILQNVLADYPRGAIDPEADRTVQSLVANIKSKSPRAQLVAAKAMADIARVADARNLAANVAKNKMLEPTDHADLLYVEGLLAEHDDYRTTAIERYVKALSFDPTRVDAATNAVSLLLELGTPEALAQIGALLGTVEPTARSSFAMLQFNESRYLHKLGRTADARACLERVIALTGGRGELAGLAMRALEETS
jgi:tetratricopeptide (TPR) repeat protein